MRENRIKGGSPIRNDDAVKVPLLLEGVDQKLGVVDLASAVLALENKMPMMLFGLNGENSIVKALTGGFTGTYVTTD